MIYVTGEEHFHSGFIRDVVKNRHDRSSTCLNAVPVGAAANYRSGALAHNWNLLERRIFIFGLSPRKSSGRKCVLNINGSKLSVRLKWLLHIRE